LKTIRIVALVSALLFTAMAIYTHPLTPCIPAIQLTFSESAFQAILDDWQSAGTYDRFKTHFALDFPFLVSYGVLGFLVSTRTRLFQNFSRPVKSLLSYTLPVAAVADAIENLMHLYFLSGAAPFISAQYLVAGVVASTKWLLILVFVCSALHACYRRNPGCR